jgi:molybdopterin converting factor small subunit
MSLTLHLTSPFRPLAEGKDRLTVSAETVGEALEAACEVYPALRPRLFDRSGALRSELRVYVNDDALRPPLGLETPVAEGDQVVLIAPLATG